MQGGLRYRRHPALRILRGPLLLQVARCAASYSARSEEKPSPFYLGPTMGDFPFKVRSPVLLVSEGSRLCPLSPLAANWEVKKANLNSFRVASSIEMGSGGPLTWLWPR